MRKMVGVLGLAALVLTTIGVATAGAKGPHDKVCIAEVRAAGDWGKTLNPGRASFVSGTEGDDIIELIEPGVVFCGLGGHDRVLVNNGWFYGGAGMDTIEVNNGTVDGGEQTDVVVINNGTFMGRNARDYVMTNMGYFDGGPASDVVELFNAGTCVSVEVGC